MAERAQFSQSWAAGRERLRDRYKGSIVQDFWTRMNAVQFGDWIILFGAAVLLSVLPLIILFSAMASRRIDNDISLHLGLSRQGAHIVESLFHSATFRFNLGVFISLILSIAGTVAVARSVQVLYERAFKTTEEEQGGGRFVRCLIWVAVFGALLFADATMSRPLLHDPLGSVLLPVVDLLGYAFFFWWTLHFLLGGKRSWWGVLPAAVATAVFWIGLGFFASIYFSSSLVSDTHLYGTIGVVFTLVTWFIAMGAVITLGAVAGGVWSERRPTSRAAA